MSEYRVHVKTGDMKSGAGTDANVKLTLFSSGAAMQQVNMNLNHLWRNNFEKGKTDTFSISLEESVEVIESIEIYQDGFGHFSDWYVEWIKVENVAKSRTYIFPVHRWIRDKEPLSLREFDSSLPQDDPNTDQRKKELEVKKNDYQFHIKYRGVLPGSYEQPSDEEFTTDYLFNIEATILGWTLKAGIAGKLSGNWASLDDIDGMYKGSNGILPRPKGMDKWRSDREFGKLRLVGCNPTVIKLCTTIPEKFGVTEEMLLPLLEGLSLQEALEKKRLFIIDYHILERVPIPAKDRQLCVPFGLFFVNRDKDLMPVALQLNQEKGPKNPVFTPSDPSNLWLMAKMWFNNADAAYHQSVTHLGFTHLLMEPVVVAANRTLSVSHPIYRLLAPHFLFLIAINTKGLGDLFKPGGWVDSNMTMGTIGLVEIVSRQLKDWRFDRDAILPESLKKRGVNDPDILPKYYYRDDAILLYNAITNYVTRIINEIYDQPEKLAKDEEIQNFAEELTSPDGASIKGIPGNGHFNNNDELILTLVGVIFTCSVQHAAANFTQYDDYAFIPNYPALLHGQTPQTKIELTEQDILKHLPNKTETRDIIMIAKLLSMKGTNPLTDFEVKYFYHPIGEAALEDFRNELLLIGNKIDARNETLDEIDRYPYLHPTQVPNSISI